MNPFPHYPPYGYKGRSPNIPHTYQKEKNRDKEKINLPQNKEKFEKHDKLKYILTTEEYSTDINNIIKLNDSRYLASDNNEFHICEIKDNQKDPYIYKSEFKQNLKYGKMIFSSGKIIFIESLEKEEKIHFLKIYYNNKFFQCEIKKEVFNIFESDNIIVLIEEKMIELFKFEEDNTSIPLYKISELEVDDQILSIEKANKFLFCGHKSGLISIWSPVSDSPFLKNIKTFKIHYNGINKLICNAKKDKEQIILITGSSDKTLKVHSLENNDRICINLIYFSDEVMDISFIHSLDKKNIYYVISLKNGVLKVLDTSFKEIWEIYSKYQTTTTRFVLEIENKENDNTKGDYILITEGKKLDKYCWIPKDKNHI